MCCTLRRADIMRRAKEVKVVKRWRADEFDGEIPIGGDDDEMLGTAMKMAEGVGQLQGIVEDSMPVIQSMTWFGFYGVGGAVAGNTAAAYLGEESSTPDRDMKYLGMRLGYLVVSAFANFPTNGFPSGMGEIARAGGVGTGSFLLSARRSTSNTKMRKYMLYGGVAGYGISTISYAVKKFKGR